MEVCRLRTTPILTFVNKMDRDIRDPIEVMDEVETVLDIQCAPMTWPIGMGRHFKGVYHLYNDVIHLYTQGQGSRIPDDNRIEGLHNPAVDEVLGAEAAEELRMEVELVRGASHEFDLEAYRRGELTPVYFGTAMGNFGVREMLDGFVEYAPPPQPRETDTRTVEAEDSRFTGFVFKIQANMDPKHRDRIAFLRVCSGKYEKNMKMRHVRIGKDVKIADALTFMVLAELQLGTLSREPRERLTELVSRTHPQDTRGKNLLCRGRPWARPNWNDYLTLHDAHPLAAWIAVMGPSVHHAGFDCERLRSRFELLDDALAAAGLEGSEERQHGIFPVSPLLEYRFYPTCSQRLAFAEGDEHRICLGGLALMQKRLSSDHERAVELLLPHHTRCEIT